MVITRLCTSHSTGPLTQGHVVQSFARQLHISIQMSYDRSSILNKSSPRTNHLPTRPRRYFVVELEGGRRVTVFHDLVVDAWYAQPYEAPRAGGKVVRAG